MSELTIEQRVAAGAKWLDENQPRWLDHVDIEALDLESCQRCVLGQLFGDFRESPLLAGLDLDSPWGDAQAEANTAPLGFDVFEGEDSCSGFAELTAEWRRVIESRRAEP